MYKVCNKPEAKNLDTGLVVVENLLDLSLVQIPLELVVVVGLEPVVVQILPELVVVKILAL